jgi:biotin carboxyl carrier protein
MKLEVEIRGRRRSVEITERDGRLLCALDGKPVDADAVEVAEATYSILLGGESFEVRVYQSPDGLHVMSRGEEFLAHVRDPRRMARRAGGGLEAQGRQQVSAPMPGKVVRVLAQAGDKVEHGQGLVVVEAMKMQNEIKSPKSGAVERVLVSEGQNVNAGQPLVVVS